MWEGMPSSLDFKHCFMCRLSIPISDSHSLCVHCLDEIHIPRKCSHCYNLKAFARKKRDLQLKVLMMEKVSVLRVPSPDHRPPSDTCLPQQLWQRFPFTCSTKRAFCQEGGKEMGSNLPLDKCQKVQLLDSADHTRTFHLSGLIWKKAPWYH